MKSHALHEAFAHAHAPDSAPNYRAFCIAVLELQASATPELVRALAMRYGLILECGAENPAL